MKRSLLFLILLLLNLIQPVYASRGSRISDCISDPSRVHKLIYFPYNSNINYVVRGDELHEFMNTESEQVGWLGYAPRNIENYAELEMLGEEYGFEGVNLYQVRQLGVLFLRDKSGRDTERFTISYYYPTHQYILMETTFDKYARYDGTAYDYHGTSSPYGGSCIWWLEAEEVKGFIHLVDI